MPETLQKKRKCYGYAGFWELSAINCLDLLRYLPIVRDDAVLCGCLDTMQTRLNELAGVPDLSNVEDYEMSVGFYPLE